MAQILIIEDEVLLAKSLSRSLVERGHDCIMAGSAEEGLSLLEKMPTDIVLLDLQLPGMTGLEAIKHIRKFDSNISVIIATAYATMASAVDAMRSGACDFLRKPLDIEEVAMAVDRAVTDARLKQTVSYYRELDAGKADEDRLVAESSKMKSVLDIADRLIGMDLANPSDYPPVLILGETGTGKDLLARIIHYQGKLASGPFIEVNCTTLPSGLEEAELFGFDKGAFTGADRTKRGLFEAASGGTIFLNEIGDLTKEAQVKLLQVIEQKCLRRGGGLRDIDLDVRVIAATHRDLKNSDGFREDLFYRLNSATLEVPPLRERTEDIIQLAELFLHRFGKKYGVTKRLENSALDALLKYSWPGNVRELRQLMERVTFLDSREEISKADLNLPIQGNAPVSVKGEGQVSVEFPTGGIDIEEVERELIVKALTTSGGNVTEAARLLHLTRETLKYRIKKFDISKEIKILG